MVTAANALNQNVSRLTQAIETAFPTNGANGKVNTYTVATVPSASSEGAGSVIFVSDETSGATLAFSDGTDWRRVQDRAVVS